MRRKKTTRKRKSKEKTEEVGKKIDQAEINIGMIGHVDHGKTSLTKMLTGKWTDTHSEELKRGISIRIGYADVVFKKCPKCGRYDTTDVCPVCGEKMEISRRVSFVDAPGHETLMATMLSGAALMQGAVLVIAANEKCPQPRTIEHLLALKLYGVKNLVVAQNKIDLVGKERAIQNYKEIKSFLQEYGYENVPIIPVSATFNVNKHYLIKAIEETIPTPKYDLKKPFLMHVARSFDINKPGTKIEKLVGGVLGGSIVQGKVKVGDEIELAPGIGDEERTIIEVTSLATQTGPIDEAKPGGLVAIGTNLDPFLTQNDQMKGRVVAKPGTIPEAVKDLTLEVHKFERVLIENKEIEKGEPLVLNIGTSTNIGIVTNKKGDVVELKLKMPAIVFKNQRIAISKRYKNSWRLVAYGVAKD